MSKFDSMPLFILHGVGACTGGGMEAEIRGSLSLLRMALTIEFWSSGLVARAFIHWAIPSARFLYSILFFLSLVRKWGGFQQWLNPTESCSIPMSWFQFVAVTDTLIKSNMGGNGSVWLTLPSHSSSLREGRAGTREPGIIVGCCLVAFSLAHLQAHFLQALF